MTKILFLCPVENSIFMVSQHLELIRREFQNKSVLKFTKEISINNRLNFLDVAIDSNGETYVPSVYRKETNKGHFMNARGECPERYKVGMICGLIDRTHKISSSIEIFNVECKIKTAFNKQRLQ